MGGAQKEDSGVERVFVKTMKDGLEGWATVEGNDGSKFLEEGGNLFKVVKETILTEAFELDFEETTGTKKLKALSRKLKIGETVEALVWPEKQEKSELTRMKCRAKSD